MSPRISGIPSLYDPDIRKVMIVARRERVDVNGQLDRATLQEYWRAFAADDVIQELFEEFDMSGIRVNSITIKAPSATRDGYMAVIKGTDEANHPFVTFRSEANVRALRMKIAADTEAGRLTFKEEPPWEPRK